MRNVEETCNALGVSVRTRRLPDSVYEIAASLDGQYFIFVDDRIDSGVREAAIRKGLEDAFRLKRKGGKVWLVHNTALSAARFKRLRSPRRSSTA